MRSARRTLLQLRDALGSKRSTPLQSFPVGVVRWHGTSQPEDEVECAVIGAGVVGLACARALALAGKEVVILEAANSWGTETSSRHSEVIHAGLYYPRGSLKAELCVKGKHLLYQYCKDRGVPHRRVTKLVVATTPSQVPDLQALYAKARVNGVTDLVWLSGEQARHMEPNLRAAAAFLSPSTGILDSHTYMSALLADAEAAGASLAVASRVVGGQVPPPRLPSPGAASAGLEGGSGAAGPLVQAPGQRPGVLLEVKDTQADTVTRLRARHVVNSAGLWAQDVSRRIGVPDDRIPPLHLARGVYFTLQAPGQPSRSAAAPTRQGGPLSPAAGDPLPPEPPGTEPFAPSASRPFSRLIYPLPQDGGLGMHLTLDLGGGVRFGPDVEWVDRVEYKVDAKRGDAFYAAIRTYWPGLPDHALLPGYAGVRPKLSGPGQPTADFMLQGRAGQAFAGDAAGEPVDNAGGHGVPGLVCLYGIESPGLTSSLAIAERVADLVCSDA